MPVAMSSGASRLLPSSSATGRSESHLKLIRQHRRSTATIGICFNIKLVIPSGPGAFRLGKALIISTISTMVINSRCSSASATK
jgi:hypothetical protein